MEQFYIVQSESAIKSGHSRSSLADILSKPVALDLLNVDNIEKSLDFVTIFI